MYCYVWNVFKMYKCLLVVMNVMYTPQLIFFTIYALLPWLLLYAPGWPSFANSLRKVIITISCNLWFKNSATILSYHTWYFITFKGPFSGKLSSPKLILSLEKTIVVMVNFMFAMWITVLKIFRKMTPFFSDSLPWSRSVVLSFLLRYFCHFRFEILSHYIPLWVYILSAVTLLPLWYCHFCFAPIPIPYCVFMWLPIQVPNKKKTTAAKKKDKEPAPEENKIKVDVLLQIHVFLENITKTQR